MNRIKVSYVLSVFLLVLLALLVLAAHGPDNIIDAPAINSPSRIQNVTGTITLNASFDPQYNQSLIINVTFRFQNTTGYFVLNTTIQNSSANQTIFQNTSFNTRLLADGKYNVSVLAVNGTVATNQSSIFNISSGPTGVVNVTVDNTPPNVTLNFLNNPVNGSNYSFSLAAVNQTFNASVFDRATDTASVYFWFDNGTGNDFNVTGINQSGEWYVSYNLSALTEQKQGVRVVANDSVGNINNTAMINFTVDFSSPNVSIVTVNGNPGNASNFSIRSSNQTFNLTIFDSLTVVQSVYFWFDNGTGQDFNITAVNQSGEWIVSWNVSQLGEGRQGIRIRANDTVGNVNNTAFNFTLDLNAPNVSIVSINANNTVNGSNFSARNINNQTFNVTISDNLTQIDTVYFTFDNGTGTDFNVTAVNQSGEWVVSWNVSILAEQKQGVRIFANDTVNNLNNSLVINFTVDRTPPNITFESLANYTRNVTYTNGTFIVNLTLGDLTNLSNVSMWIVNRTGGVVIQTRTLTQSGGYWNATVAAGELHYGNFSLQINATDFSGNINATERVIVFFDNITPSFTSFTCTDIDQGGRQTCNCVAFDDSENFTGGALNFTYGSVDTSVAGTASTTCRMRDLAGNENVTSANFIITAASSSSSSSSSGGGSSSSSSSSSRGATTSGSESGASSGSSGESSGSGGSGGAGSQASETGTQQGVEGAAGEGTSQEVGSSRNFAGRAFSAIFGEAGSRSVLPLVIVGVLIVALGAGIFFWTRKK